VLDYQDLDAEISRREELMCAQVLVDGRLAIVDWDNQQKIMEVNFGPVNEVVIDPAEYWDAPTSNPLDHLELMRRHVTASGYLAIFTYSELMPLQPYCEMKRLCMLAHRIINR
jgi:hypothetical protein